ncbi:MAG TPA: class I SAM-dependent methyltransferase [Myxococcales bacterium]|nr:class I SAM-dependent methyltransferase [Myxococcales bacterium]
MEGSVHSNRWEQEAQFFDAQAAAHLQRPEPIDPSIVARYEAPGRLFAKEYCCRFLGNLEDKLVLDFGCGEGDDALLLASLGARVTAIDISPKAIEFARVRAEMSGVASRITFVCAPIEAAELPAGHFDVIWGDNILHHVLPVLDETLAALMRAAKPGAQVVFNEPVVLNRLLRRIRLFVPVHTDTTPGERPLEPSDIEIIRRHIPAVKNRYFRCFARLARLFVRCQQLETASPFQRALTKMFAATDYFLLSLPGIERLAGVGVFYGRAPLAFEREEGVASNVLSVA